MLSTHDAERRASQKRSSGDYLLTATIVLIVGLWVYTRLTASLDDQHVHPPGAHGGVIVSMADDRYHAEALVEQGGVLRLMMLGPSTDQIIDVEQQTLVAYVANDRREVTQVTLSPEPQAGDDSGRTSQFAGRLPEQFAGKNLSVTIAPLRINGQRYRLAFAWPPESQPHESQPHESQQPAMPAKVADDAERRLYLEPAGLYTADDIRRNGGLTASQKFPGFKARHDFDPQPGDLLCPVTRTKANPACSWIIGGRRYTFCCPPCVDEFLDLAKRSPEQVRLPEQYVQ